MKFTYIKLKNFIGIYAGMKQKEVEINLDCEYPLIMLLSDNGKGKTTIQSSISPFRESLDGRTNLILDGELGYKEVHIQDKDDKYIIKHYYGDTSKLNKSFIEKNGEELNDNGGIRTFNTVVEKELGITKEYFKIARLGANVDTFVNLNSNDRKKYISNFIPDIDDILEAYNSAKDTYNALNKEMRKLDNSLTKIGDINILRELNETIEKQQEEEEEVIQELKSEIYMREKAMESADITTSELVDIIKGLHKDLQYKTRIYEKSGNNVNAIYKKYPKLTEYSLEKAKETYESNKIDRDAFKKTLEVNSIKIAAINDKMSGYTVSKLIEFSEEELEELKENASNFEDKIRCIDEELLDCKETNKTEDELLNSLNKVTNEFESIKIIIDETDKHIIDERLSRVNLVMLQSKKDALEHRIEETNNTIQNIEGRRKTAELIRKRPVDCIIDSCPFISAAIEANKDLDQLDRLYSDLNSDKDELAIVESRIEESERIEQFYNEIDEFSRKYKRSNVLEMIYDGSYMKFYEDIIRTYNKKLTYVRNSEQKEKYNTLLESINSNISTINKTKERNNQLTEANKRVQEKYDECKEEIAGLIYENNEINKQLDRVNKKLSILANLIDALENQEARKDDIKDIKDTLQKRQTTLEEMNEHKKRAKECKKQLNDIHLPKLNMYKKKYDNNKALLIEADRLVKRMNEINKNFSDIKLIKDSLDPKKGIPMVFIETFLTDISEKTNKLLDIAYGGKFQINFELTDKDFFIQVLKSDGTILRDIKDCSQGEFSMTMISLSLAMLERNMSKFNIVYLDEVDATLSTENRRTFIEILLAQISTLGIEQVFVISHNQEFHSYPLGLILLEGYDIDVNDEDIMCNKEVLYKMG